MKTLFLTVAVGLAAFGAAAQATPERDARIAADAFGTCAVGRNATAARDYVMGDRNDAAGNNWFVSTQPNCGRTLATDAPNLAVSGAMLQQVLANALMQREFARSGPADFATIGRISSTTAPVVASDAELAAMDVADRISRQAADTTAQSDFIYAQIGECIARLAPEQVRTLALTPVASPAEHTGVVGLTSQIATCLPEGTTVRIRPATLRGWAVLQYYRMAHTPPTLPPPAATPAATTPPAPAPTGGS